VEQDKTPLLERLRRLIPILVLAAIVLPAAIVTACGSSSASSEDAQKVMNETFNGEKKVDSGKLNLDVSANLQATGLAAQQLKGPVTLKVSGPFQSRGETELPALDLQLTAGGTGQDFSAGAISTGDKGYISYQGKDYAVPDKVFRQYKKSFSEQQKKDRNKNQLDLAALGIDPKKWLTNPKNEGVEKVAGADTIHVSAGVNVGAFLDDINDLLQRTDQLGLTKQQKQQLPGKLSSSTKKQIQDSVKKAKLDVFTGKDDKTLRRLELAVSFDLPESLKSQAQGLEGGDLKLKLELAELNQKQDISAPANARPWSELQQQLGVGALGSALGGGSKGQASTPGSGGFIPGGTTGRGNNIGSGLGSGGGISARDKKRTQRYLKCVQKANTPEDIQGCVSELNK
jgi:hypothetical protein